MINQAHNECLGAEMSNITHLLAIIIAYGRHSIDATQKTIDLNQSSKIINIKFLFHFY